MNENTNNNVTPVTNRVKFDLDMDEHDVLAIQRLAAENDIYSENIALAISRGGVASNETLEYYQSKQLEARTNLNKLKDVITRKYIPEYLLGKHRVNWEVNSILNQLNVEVTCSCGCELVKNDPNIQWKEY